MELDTGNKFNNLVKTISRLLGPQGCPWDHKQTVHTWACYLIEEIYELLDSIEDDHFDSIANEIGDVIAIVLFLAMTVSKEKGENWDRFLDEANQKLIRRHPHIFQKPEELSHEEIESQWKQIKKTEKGYHTDKKCFVKIPRSYPPLETLDKIIRKAQHSPSKQKIVTNCFAASQNEEEKIAAEIAYALLKAAKYQINPKEALTKLCTKLQEQLHEEPDFPPS